MFTPAYSTYQDRQDLQYGLGWYVQEFEGLRLLWHTGRWPPSTSALYLKVPEENLTLIVLANTDNLTIPFDAIGFGDVSKSALALSFFRHFDLPRADGSAPDRVDWSEPRETLVDKLSAVQDERPERYLERELWAFRQAFASVGRDDQVLKLWRTSMRAFPRSDKRADPLYTKTASRSAYGPLSCRRGASIEQAGASSSGLPASSSRWSGCWSLFCARQASPHGEWVVWLLATGLLGPLALVAHKLVRAPPGRRPLQWQQALKASLFSVAPYVMGWVLALAATEDVWAHSPTRLPFWVCSTWCRCLSAWSSFEFPLGFATSTLRSENGWRAACSQRSFCLTLAFRRSLREFDPRQSRMGRLPRPCKSRSSGRCSPCLLCAGLLATLANRLLAGVPRPVGSGRHGTPGSIEPPRRHHPRSGSGMAALARLSIHLIVSLALTVSLVA